MNRPVIAIVAEGSSRQTEARGAARAGASSPRRAPRCARCSATRRAARDLLIEHLHKIQDRYGCLHDRAPGRAGRRDEARRWPRSTRSRPSITTSTSSRKATPRRRRSRCASATACPASWPARRTCWRGCRRCSARDVRVIAAPCVGRCEQAPAAVVGQNPVAARDARQRSSARGRGEATRQRPAGDYIDYAAYRADGGYALLRPSASAASATSKPSSRRWRTRACAAWAARAFRPGASGASCASEPAPRLMAVNIDEGEPGTFKDRIYLERDPHRFLEGMLIAALGGRHPRHLHLPARRVPRLPRDARARARASCSADPPCALPRIELRRGAGAYICGEESAMIESIEGKRGMPRLRPPYVAQVGLFGRPTLEHNFETLYWVRDIVEKGARVVRRARPQRPQGPALVLGVGPRARARASSWRRPASRVQRADRRILRRHAAGPRRSTPTCRAARRAASCRRRMGDIPLDFDTLQPHGCFIGSAAVIVLSRPGHARATRRCNMMRFFEHESLRPVHAVPRRHRQGGGADGSAEVGPRRCSKTCRR